MTVLLGITKIISGGQTGVDRGALDAAMELGIAHGGWCPKGRRAEDGVVPLKYQLTETASRRYAERTEKNVLDADATLILFGTHLVGGTALTQRLAQRHRRPHRIESLDTTNLQPIRDWILDSHYQVLNIAGPRESTTPGAWERTFRLLLLLFSHAHAR